MLLRCALIRCLLLLALTLLVGARSATEGNTQLKQNQSGDPKADLRYALSHLDSPDYICDKACVIEALERAANRGDVSAKFHLAHLYSPLFDDHGVKNEARAHQLLLEVARTGDPYAAEIMGSVHPGATRKELATAAKWLEIAAKANLRDTAWRLAWLFGGGPQSTRLPPDPVETYKWLDIHVQMTQRRRPPAATEAAESRDTLAKTMSAAEVSEAQRRSRAWMAALPDHNGCNTQQERIRIVVMTDDMHQIGLAPWMQEVQDQLKTRVIPPPCSHIESRSVMTFRVFKDRPATQFHGKVESPLGYFELAVHSALEQIRTGIRLPADSPRDELELIVRAYYNENPWVR